MSFLTNIDSELLFIIAAAYLLVSISVARLGMGKVGGVTITFVLSLIFTPLTGLVYSLSSPVKNLIHTTHYHCPKCGLDHTENHEFCPSCLKEGKKSRLRKIQMKTF
jgi:hypothetical protein